jgi:hypothetical protein
MAKPESAASLFEQAAAMFKKATEAKAREEAASTSGKTKASQAAQATPYAGSAGQKKAPTKPKKPIEVCEDSESYTSSF